MHAPAGVDFYYPTRHRLRRGVLIRCFFCQHHTTNQTDFFYFFAHFSLT